MNNLASIGTRQACPVVAQALQELMLTLAATGTLMISSMTSWAASEVGLEVALVLPDMAEDLQEVAFPVAVFLAVDREHQSTLMQKLRSK
jgi:hypothetical protein